MPWERKKVREFGDKKKPAFIIMIKDGLRLVSRYCGNDCEER